MAEIQVEPTDAAAERKLIPKEYAAARDLHNKGDLQRAERGYLVALQTRYEDPLLLFFLGTLYMQLSLYGKAIVILTRCVELHDRFPEAWNNLGTCLRAINKHHDAEQCFLRANRMEQSADHLNNLATLYVQAGDPAKGRDYAEQAIKLKPDHPQAHWNRGLCLLEQGDWEGWKEYHYGYRSGGRANRQYDCAPWKGQHVGKLILFGEQGVGDELLFGSMLPDAAQRVDELYLDVHPRLVSMFKRAFPNAHIFGTRKATETPWFYEHEPFDAKASMADLAVLFRMTDESFPGRPYIPVDEAKRAEQRARLETKAMGRPIIGISWQGGTPKTGLNDRSIIPTKLDPLFKLPCLFVSLQYGQEAAKVAQLIAQTSGIDIFHKQSWIDDFDALTSLADACDLVVTVDQTLVWQCGAIGKQAWVMIPHKTSWRFPPRFGSMTPWFKSLRLYRQAPDCDWTPVIDRIAAEMKEKFGC